MNLERLLIVLAVIALAVLLGIIQNRGVAMVRHRRTFTDLEPGLVVFASRSCAGCDTVEGMVASYAGGREHRIYWWDESPEVFERNDIDRVPAVASVAEDGTGWIAVGVPPSARLRRWLRGP